MLDYHSYQSKSGPHHLIIFIKGVTWIVRLLVSALHDGLAYLDLVWLRIWIPHVWPCEDI